MSLPPAHHHRLPLGVCRDGAQADWLGQLIELSCSGKLDQPNVIDDSKTTISLVSGIILVDNKVPLIDLKFLNSRELVPLVVKGGAEVEHPQGHSELGQILLLAVGSRNKEPWRYEHSRADPGVNILNTSRPCLFHLPHFYHILAIIPELYFFCEEL